MNSLENSTPGVSTQKIRLRRVPTKRELIQNNLLQVKQNAIKKQKAQIAYYSNKVQNQSPLRRQGAQGKNVQNRLGLKKSVIFTNTNKNQQRIQQQPQLVLTTNKTNINNRNNFRRQYRQNQNSQQVINKFNTRNNFANRNQKFLRLNSIQERLNQIRQQPKSVKNFRNLQQQVVINGQNKIKLRRPLSNYKIQVPTNEHQQNQSKHRTLNPQLQAEIKAIQSRVAPEEDIAMPVASNKIGVTGITLNDRFSKLM